MIVLGLTGSIGMGKSTASGYFRMLGVPVFDADAAVHHLYRHDGPSIRAIAALCPEAAKDGRINRMRLGKKVFGDPELLQKLEAILHPGVRRLERRFLQAAIQNRAALTVLDIPLLLETGGDDRCDMVAVVSAPAFLQEIRVLRRPGMTSKKFTDILARQLPDAEKRNRADYIISSGCGKRDMLRAIMDIKRSLGGLRGRAWPTKFPRDI